MKLRWNFAFHEQSFFYILLKSHEWNYSKNYNLNAWFFLSSLEIFQTDSFHVYIVQLSKVKRKVPSKKKSSDVCVAK